MSQKKKVWTILLSCITLFFTIVLLWQYNVREGIKKNKIIVIGKIIEYEQGLSTKGQSPQFVYYYYVNGASYKYFRHTNWPKDGSIFIYKSFPVVCDSTNPKNSRLLIFPDEFRDFNIPFPDSLQWVLDYQP